MRILLIEDQVELAKQITVRIERAGFDLDKVETCEAAILALDKRPYSLALLDRRLPDGDGLSLVSHIRQKQPATRVLMLTALDALDNRIEGLEAGADDYLTKPFNLDELIARIRAHLRRQTDDATPPVKIGALTVDLSQHAISLGGHPVLFLRRELVLLETLARRVNCVVTREVLISHIYGPDAEVQEHALTALVSRLRARLSELDAGVEIHLARGLGYMLTRKRGREEL
jgi:two-component system, OmpR family, response regulator